MFINHNRILLVVIAAAVGCLVNMPQFKLKDPMMKAVAFASSLYLSYVVLNSQGYIENLAGHPVGRPVRWCGDDAGIGAFITNPGVDSVTCTDSRPCKPNMDGARDQQMCTEYKATCNSGSGGTWRRVGISNDWTANTQDACCDLEACKVVPVRHKKARYSELSSSIQ